MDKLRFRVADEKKLAKAVSASTAHAAYYGNPFNDKPFEVPIALGDVNGWFGTPFYLSGGAESPNKVPTSYKEEIAQCRYFYRYDPITATVINRMVDMAITRLMNRRARCNDKEMAYYNAVAEELYPALQAAAMEYLLSGMAIIEYGTKRAMGQDVSPDIGGRTRYTVPDSMWVRNPDHIVLKRVPGSMKRQVFVKLPDDEIHFIMNEGERSDGTKDKEAYRTLVDQFPDYVRRVRAGERMIELPNAKPILRRPMVGSDYPQPYLVPALGPLKHKQRIKQMDYSIASKAIEAVMLINAGNDDYPVTEDDDTLEDIKRQMQGNRGTAENIYRLFTNHTIKITWVYPPLDALLSDVKYSEPNAEIFMAMGFSRVLLTGEAGRSNAGSSVSSTMGAIATLSEMRNTILRWIKELYKDMAEQNNFKNVPEPMFSTIAAADTVALAQYAIEAVKLGALSKNTVSRMFGTDFETEYQQIQAEIDIADDTPVYNAVYDKPEPPAAPTTGTGSAPKPDGDTKAAPDTPSSGA